MSEYKLEKDGQLTRQRVLEGRGHFAGRGQHVQVP